MIPLFIKKIGLVVTAAILAAVGFVTHKTPEPNQSINTQSAIETPLGATNAIETPVALFQSTLANSIDASATQMTLSSALTKDGTNLASSTYSFIIDEGTASQEFVKADCTSTVCTNMARGLSVTTGTTTITSSAKIHRRGASVKITDAPILLNLTRIISGIGTLPNKIYYTDVSTSSIANGGNDYVIPSKGYVDYVGSSGCANASETTRGCSELATQIEMASTTTTGATGAGLTLQAKYATSSPKVAGLYVPITQNDGKLNPNFIATSSSYNYLVAASTTFIGRTEILANSTTTNPLVVNGKPIAFPATQGAASSTLVNDGTGSLSWQVPNWELIASTTLTSAVATTTLSGIPARNSLRIIVDTITPATSQAKGLYAQFNSDTGSNYAYLNYSVSAAGSISANTSNVIKLTQASAGSITSGASQSLIIFDVINDISKRKYGFFKVFVDLNGGVNAGDLTQGTFRWNNTSSQITSISIGVSSVAVTPEAQTLSAGTRIYVYGSRD